MEGLFSNMSDSDALLLLLLGYLLAIIPLVICFIAASVLMKISFPYIQRKFSDTVDRFIVCVLLWTICILILDGPVLYITSGWFGGFAYRYFNVAGLLITFQFVCWRYEYHAETRRLYIFPRKFFAKLLSFLLLVMCFSIIQWMITRICSDLMARNGFLFLYTEAGLLPVLIMLLYVRLKNYQRK
jgi:hypothetical protein